MEKHFAFGRVIETSSSVLVEIFRKTASAKTDINGIIESGIMFSPIQIWWDGIYKKRWKIIGQTENYDKVKDSNYNNIKMAFGIGEDLRLRDFGLGMETPISRAELAQYEFSVVWYPIDLENRILKYLAN